MTTWRPCWACTGCHQSAGRNFCTSCGIARSPSRTTTDLPSAWRDYAALGVKDWPEKRVQDLVAARMARKSVLSGKSAPIVSIIVDESVLCRPVGGRAVMAAQLHNLLRFSQRPNVTVRVLPFDAGATPGLEGPAALCELRDGSSVVFVESQGLSAFLSDAPAISRVREALRRLAALALTPEASSGRIQEAVEQFGG